MTMEGFVRAVGAAMGAARDLHGTAPPEEVMPAVNAPVAASRQGFGTGQAAEAADAESAQLNTRAAALSDDNAIANRQLADTQASINAGRARMDGHIAGATADVARL